MNAAPNQSEPRSRSILTIGLAIVLIVGCGFFAWRGPVRAIWGSYDFTLIYSSARAWLHGESPYEKEAVARAWLSGGGAPERDPMIARGPATLVYPPPAFAALAPLAALPWNAAAWALAILNTALVALSLAALARVGGLTGNAKLALFAVGIWMGPAMTAISQGQMGIIVLGCVCMGILARSRGRSVTAGALLGIGAALKPQLGFLFVVYEAGRLRFRVVSIAAAAIVLLTAIGIGRMEAAGLQWSSAWRANLKAFTALDDANPAKSNPIRYQLINLHYPMHNISDDPAIARVGVYAIGGLLCAAYFLVDRKRRGGSGEGRGELVSLSMVSVMTLMVAYHRYYDAVVLLIPLALAIRGIAARDRRHWLTLVLVLLFVLPFPVLAVQAVERGWLPRSLSGTWLWSNIVLPSEAWAALALCAWLVWVRRGQQAAITQTPT